MNTSFFSSEYPMRLGGTSLPSVRNLLVSCAAFASLTFLNSASAVVLDWVQVGNPGNAPDAATGSLYGAVPYTFSLSTYDVTVNQYVEFLNAKDPSGTNALRLFSASMGGVVDLQGTLYGGIDFNAANPAGSKYSAKPGMGKRPASSVSFYSAVRFANWIHNGQGNGDTESGAYTLGALGADAVPIDPRVTHNVGARVWIPTENEWYKAAYHGNRDTSSLGYFKYPTSSNKTPTGSAPSSLPNHVNAWPVGGGTNLPNNTTDVGAYSGTKSPYGAYDMGGNVFQWTETVVEPTALYPFIGRGIRGGSFAGSTNDLLSSFRNTLQPTADTYLNNGFRLASFEPGVVAPPLPPSDPVSGQSNTLSVKTTGGKGSVRSSDGQINCGKICATTVSAGANVTLTATPEVGFRFVNWTGACVGTSAICVVQVFGSLTAQANFAK